MSQESNKDSQVKDQQSYIPIFLAYLTFQSSSQEHQPTLTMMQGHMVDLKIYRATSGERNFIEQMKVSFFLESVFTLNLTATIQFRKERQPQHIKQTLFGEALTCLNKRYISSVKSYKYLNKLISYV